MQDFPEVAQWAAVRERLKQRAPLLDNAATHDQADLENWEDLNSIFCPPLAMGMYLMPEIYSLWPAPWHDYVLRQYMTGKNCAIAGPRRRGKSKIWQAYQMYKMLTLDWTHSLHICYGPDLVLEHSQSVRNQLENNRRLQEQFNIHYGPGLIQQQDYFQVYVGKTHRTTLTFEWTTRDGTPRGKGIHGIGVDDIDTQEDSPYVMMSYRIKLHSTVFGALEPFEGTPPQMIVSGNFTGRQCNMVLFQTINAIEKPDEWIVMVIPAIEQGETQHITRVPVGQSVWPDRFTTEETQATIDNMNMTRARSGDMELLNEFVDVGDLIWLPEMFEHTYSEYPSPQHCVSRVYIDASQKTQEVGDEWGIVTITKVIDGPRKGEYLLERGRLAQLAPDDAALEVISQFIGRGTKQMPQCEWVKKESITTKGEDPFLALVKTKARMMNVNIPTEEVTTHGLDKRARAMKAVPIARAGALRVPVHPDVDMKRIVTQMQNFTGKTDRNMHAVDDGHDAIVHGLIDLMQVETKNEDRVEPLVLKNKLKAVAA